MTEKGKLYAKMWGLITLLLYFFPLITGLIHTPQAMAEGVAGRALGILTGGASDTVAPVADATKVLGSTIVITQAVTKYYPVVILIVCVAALTTCAVIARGFMSSCTEILKTIREEEDGGKTITRPGMVGAALRWLDHQFLPLFTVIMSVFLALIMAAVVCVMTYMAYMVLIHMINNVSFA